MSAGRAPSLRVLSLAFALQLRKKHGKTSVRVVIHNHINNLMIVDDWLKVHHSIALADLQPDAQNSCLFTYIY